MKKVLMSLMVSLMIVGGSAMAAVFTPTVSELSQFYQTDENPASGGTSLSSITLGATSVKFVGDILLNGSGTGDISIGVNSTGVDYNGTTGLATLAALGLSDLTAFESYELGIRNKDENAWSYYLYVALNGTYYQSAMVSIASGATMTLALDLSGLADLNNVTDLGFGITGSVPIIDAEGDSDYTWETVAKPVPEPATMLLLGSGLLGLFGFRKRRV